MSKSGIKVDSKAFRKHVIDQKLTDIEMTNIGGAGAAVIRNTQVLDVPVDTAATKLSIKSHIVTATPDYYEDDVGPETVYAPFIEYGTSMPNYPMQPFIRPSVQNNIKNVTMVVSSAFGSLIRTKWL